MPEMTSEERAAHCHELRMRLNALDALEENERLFEEFRRTMEEAQAALEGSAEGAEGAVEDIGKAQEALDAFNDLLEGTSDFLEGASDALAEVSEGVEQFGDAAGDVAGALEEINSTMQQIEDLQNLSEASAQDMINGLGEHIGGIVDTLGPLIDTIPGMGAFLHMYGEGPAGLLCTYAMAYEVDTPPHPPYAEPPVVLWERNGTVWAIETPAHFLSASYPGGFVCVYAGSDIWILEVTDAEWDGDRWVATAFTGTLVRESHLDPDLSAAAIAAEYCPPWAEATAWDVEATGRVSVP